MGNPACVNPAHLLCADGPESGHIETAAPGAAVPEGVSLVDVRREVWWVVRAVVDQVFHIAWQNACTDVWSGDQTGWLFEDRVMRALEATAEMVVVEALWRLGGGNLHELAFEIGCEIKSRHDSTSRSDEDLVGKMLGSGWVGAQDPGPATQ